MISKEWRNSVYRFWKVSERIAVIQLRTRKTKNKVSKTNKEKCEIDHVITLVNTYAPTSERTKKHPRETQEFYRLLFETVKDLKQLSTSIVLIAGDFNGKVGKRFDGQEKCLGRWSRGT